MNFIINLLVTAVAAFVLGKYVLPGVAIDGFGAAIIFALVLGLLNAVLKPILVILTIPVTIFTLGLFLLVINAIIILIADYFIPGISVDGILWALGFSLLLSLLTSFLQSLLGTE